MQCICRLFKLCNPATLSPLVDTTAALLVDAESLQKALNSNWSNRYEVKAAGRLALLLLSDSSEMQADSELVGNQIQAVLDRLEDRVSYLEDLVYNSNVSLGQRYSLCCRQIYSSNSCSSSAR